MEGLGFAAPEVEELEEGVAGEGDARCVVAGVEGHHVGREEVLVDEELDTMAVGEEFARVGVLEIHVVDETEGRDAAREETEATLHALFGCEGEFAFTDDLLELGEIEGFVTLHRHEVVTFAAMIAKKDVLAMSAPLEVVERVPVGEPFFDGEERGMVDNPVGERVGIEEVEDFGYAWRCHLRFLCFCLIFWGANLRIFLRIEQKMTDLSGKMC